MDGILLGGGSGSRLTPLTISTNKHFFPVYDKPMIYYSLSILLLSNVKQVTLICDKSSIDQYKKLLGEGEEFGIKINYSLQNSPDGLPHAIATGLKEFPMEKFMVVLGDNFLYGREFFNKFDKKEFDEKNVIFYQKVSNPSGFGVLDFDVNGNLKRLIEKPDHHVSNYVAIGVYIFDKNYLDYYEKINKSSRGEYEIIDIINAYLDDEKIMPFNLGRGMSWLDMGSYDSLATGTSFVKSIQDRQHILVNSPHEIAFRKGFINSDLLASLIQNNPGSQYFQNLNEILDN